VLVCLAVITSSLPVNSLADVLVSTNGQRFVGKAIEETSDGVVFESQENGRFTFPRAQILELQLSPVEEATKPPAVATAEQKSGNAEWRPPGVGHDHFDWIQLESGEWLKGHITYIQNKEIEFDSDELEELTLDLKKIARLYSADPMFVQFENHEPVYGRVEIDHENVNVLGPEYLSLHRTELTGITPSGGKAGISNWRGRFNLGLNTQSGNTEQVTLNSSARLERRTPNTVLLIDFLGNFTQTTGVKTVSNQRLNISDDIRLDHKWFVRAIQFEAYRDPLSNISYRFTAGVGVGYYIFDRDDLEWTVSAGPGYQSTKFDQVPAGESDSDSTPSAGIQSRFSADITKRLTFIQTLDMTFTNPDSGKYTHHAVTTLEYEIKRHFTLDTSFVWDYLQNPKARSDGVIPQKSDYYTILSIGFRF
jgi:putative salt-induced outer membrane protein YdiY